MRDKTKSLLGMGDSSKLPDEVSELSREPVLRVTIGLAFLEVAFGGLGGAALCSVSSVPDSQRCGTGGVGVASLDADRPLV